MESDETRPEGPAAEFAAAWLAAAAEATGDEWTADILPDGCAAVLQTFRSAKGSRDPNVVHGAVYCTAPSRALLAEKLFDCAKDGLWPLPWTKGCGSPEEATLRFAARGVVP